MKLPCRLRAPAPARVLATALLVLAPLRTHAAGTSDQPDLASVVAQLNQLRSEMNELRGENRALREQLGAVEAVAKKPAPPAPAANPTLRLAGELRLRYEGFYGRNPAFVDRARERLRLRFGGTAAIASNVEIGMRLTTGVMEGEPTGNNATWQDNASKKAFALDLAYVKWTALKQPDSTLTLIGGKMNNPFSTSDLVFDPDYTPEGVAAQYARTSGRHTLRVNTAAFVLDELAASAHDPMLFAGQVCWEAKWSPTWSTTLGAGWFDITDASRLTNAAVPDVHRGNTRTAAGSLVHEYRPYAIDAAVVRTFEAVPGYPGAFPVTVFSSYISNPELDADNEGYLVGLTLGRATKAGTWELTYRYRAIESDAWYEELTDSDSGGFYQVAPAGGAAGYGGGANVRGHIFSGSYAVTDYALLGFTYYSTRLIKPWPAGSQSAMGRLQLNTILKF